MPTAATRSKQRSKRPSAVDQVAIAEAVKSAVGSHLLYIARAQMVPTLPSEGFIRLRDLLKIFPISESAWWAGVREGRYPKPVQLGAQLRAWKVSDVRKLISAVSDGKQPEVWPRELTREAAHAGGVAEV